MKVEEMIVSSSRIFEARGAYKLTHLKETEQVKDLPDGATYSVHDWLVYLSENKDGETNEVLLIIAADEDGVEHFLTTVSSTFKESFLEMADSFGCDFIWKKISGKSKAGREYVDCEFVE